jgi:hypothetical protein
LATKINDGGIFSQKKKNDGGIAMSTRSRELWDEEVPELAMDGGGEGVVLRE